MTHIKHIDPESWRHGDAGLRRAVQQHRSGQPQLPTGFAERMMTRLDSNIPQPSPRRRRLWPLAAAIAAAASLAIAFFVIRPKEQAVVADARPTTPPATQLPAESHDVTAQPRTPDKAVTSPRLSDERQATPHAAGKLTTVADKIPAELLATGTTTAAPVVSDADTVTSTADTTSAPAITPIDQPRQNHLVAEATTPSEAPRSAGQQDYSSVGIDLKRTKASSARITLATTIGFDGALMANSSSYSSYSQPPSQPTDKPANYYLLIGNGYAYDLSQTASVKSQFNNDISPSTSDEQPQQTRQHYVPFTIGVNLSIPLSRLWYVETGIAYSRLSSSLRDGTSTDFVLDDQRIHYLGIPLRAQYRFLQRRFLTAYATAGGAIDIPLKAKVESTHFSESGRTPTSTTTLSAPVQFSTSLSVGLQFNCNKHFGIYAEPQLLWYIPTGSDITTYRTAHPLRFVPAVGLRWTL